MKLDEAQSVVNLLARKMGVQAPVVERSRGHSRSFYYWPSAGGGPQGTIRLAKGHTICCVLHEFAHHLTSQFDHTDAARARYRGLRRRATRKKHRWSPSRREARVFHGYFFTAKLIEVASVWFGDPRKYRWNTEYACVQREARRQLA